MEFKPFRFALHCISGCASAPFSGRLGKRKGQGKSVAADFPWLAWQQAAFGILRWTPKTFWNSSLTEFLAALDGFTEARGGKKNAEPPTDAQMDDLLKKYGKPKKPA
ncbi:MULTISPECIES: phage tail assembly chaperone [Brucella]|uniref:phage tail assembly chaperone n=1 Tax=Brucella pseudintermedia TaxID=370111 RepID=UPI00124E9747|nr:phage tail assembly chaperone [Brucella pseudintermedia]